MFKAFVFLLVLYSQLVSAKNIVFLSSLPKKDQKTTNKLKKLFFKKMYGISQYADGNQLIYHDMADAQILYHYLNDPDTMALFWVGHGGFKKMGKTTGSGIRPAAILLDYEKKNVAKVFQRVHPNIKFLGVIGCNSWQILENVISTRPDLGYYIPSKKVIATWSFRKALKRFRQHFWSQSYKYLEQDSLETAIPITIERSVSQASVPLMIFAGKKIIGVMPAVNVPSIQKQNFFIPYKEGLKKHDLKISISTGHGVAVSSYNFGNIVIGHRGEKLWKLFAKSDGTAFGVTERIFIFQGNLNNIFYEDYILYMSYNEESL